MREPSRHLLESFSGIGSPSLDCMCGRHHYAPDSEFCEGDEDVTMKEHAARDPKRVLLHEGEDAIYAKIINSMTAVVNCPCDFLAKFEDVLWNERDRILSYYKLRREADAKALANLDSALSGEGKP